MKALTLAATLLLPLAAPAQDAAPKPVIKPGEVAVYDVQLRHERRSAEDTLTVTSVEGNVVKVRQQRRGDTEARDGESLFDDEWNQLTSALSGSRFEPHTGSLKFPLAAGSSWRSQVTVHGSRGMLSRYDAESRVSGPEKVRTPAGEFDAWRIDTEGWVNGVSWRGSFKRRMAQWYAPAVQRVVRTEIRDFRTQGDDVVSELKSFQPAP